MKRDPYYPFNNSMAQITPDCCQFLEELAKCMSPNMGRSREKREKQLGTGVSTRLIFMPDKERDITKPLDMTKEVMVAHHARLFTLPQFAVLAAELLKARGEPTPMLYGWAGSVLPIDQAASQDCFFDLVHFARRQWHEQYHNVKGEEYSFEETATAISDRFSNRLLNAGSVASMVTNRLSVKGDGPAAMAGVGKPDTQAAREGRPIIQIGGRAISRPRMG